MRKIIFILFIFNALSLLAVDKAEFDELKDDGETVYVVRLTNGDMLTGVIEKKFEDGNYGSAIKLRSLLGNTTIYITEISDIWEKMSENRHRHRVFLMPTAVPISDNHYIGNYELLFFMGGIGISDYVSITAGRSLIPGIGDDNQVTLLNLKATVYDIDWTDRIGGLTIALGGNIALVNDDNQFQHVFGCLTFRGNRTDVTGMVFTKVGNGDFYEYRFRDEQFSGSYNDGSFGIGLGLTSKFTEWHDMSFIGEVWNNDVSKATNTAISGGLRMQNTSFAADFGLMLFTEPFVIPFFSFTYTPF